MGKLLGAKAQSTYQRWETSPTSPAAKEALERARALYSKKKGKAWEAPAAAGPALTREEFAEWRGYWKKGTEELLQRLEDLARRIDQLEKRSS
jgi:predicted transcriptional regulator